MRSFDFAPLYRSTVGFDRLFDMLDGGTRPDWPPYDIEKADDNRYRISMAVAGFAPGDIELTQHGSTLVVTGQKTAEKDRRELLHQGIAFRNFKQTFNLADHVRVTEASLDNGLLLIDLLREVPEQLKPRRIDIASAAGATPVQNNQPQPKQIEQAASKDKAA